MIGQDLNMVDLQRVTEGLGISVIVILNTADADLPFGSIALTTKL